MALQVFLGSLPVMVVVLFGVWKITKLVQRIEELLTKRIDELKENISCRFDDILLKLLKIETKVETRLDAVEARLDVIEKGDSKE